MEKDEIEVLNFEDWSDRLVPVEGRRGLYEYAKPTSNNDLVCEDSLVRTLAQAEGKDFAVLSAYRLGFTKRQNIVRNRKMRAVLNAAKMGVHQLVGHWLEAPDGTPYADADSASLKDTVERSYLVVRLDSMTLKDFVRKVAECMTVDGKTQDAAIVHKASDGGYYLMDARMEFFAKIGERLTLGQIGQAYSQHVKKTSLPFKFEGKEIPSSNSGKMMFEKYMML